MDPEQQEPLGIQHLTVVPENFEERSEDEDRR